MNIHRANVLWYNPKVLAEYNVAVPTDFASFVAALEALKAAGMESPLSLGEAWTEVHMFETILLAPVGADLAAQRAHKIPIATAGWLEDIRMTPTTVYQPYTTGTYGARQVCPLTSKQFKTRRSRCYAD